MRAALKIHYSTLFKVERGELFEEMGQKSKRFHEKKEYIQFTCIFSIFLNFAFKGGQFQNQKISW